MIITTILGSPRRAGNTAKVLKAFERLAAADHDVFRIDIAEKTIGGCLGCDAREMNYLYCRVAGIYVAPWCTAPAELGDKAEMIAQEMREGLQWIG